MSQISEFRVYGERKYTVDGEWKTEEIELGQFSKYNTSSIDDNKFIRFDENSLLTAHYSAFNTYKCSGYKPGKIYIPPKTFQMTELFSHDEIGEFYREMVTNWGVDYHTSKYILKFSEDVFWQNPDGYNIYPYLLGQYVKSSYNINDDSPEKIKRTSQYVFGFMMTKLDVKNIIAKYDGFYHCNDLSELKIYLDKHYFVADPVNTNGFYSGKIFGGPVFSSTKLPYPAYASMQENINGLIRFVQIIQKVKIIPMWNYGGVSYYKDDNGIEWSVCGANWSKPETVDETETSKTVCDNMGLLLDISDAPYFSRKGFGNTCASFYRRSITSTGAGVNASLGIVTRIDWSGGPEPNNPEETDDPNVDDPGFGPGQDPDDSGGDGDHDNTSDIIEPPTVPTLSATGVGLVTVYNPSSSQLESLSQKLWNPDALEAIKQFFTNPLDTVIGCSIIPVKPKIGTTSTIHLGIYDTEVSAPVVDSDYVIVNCGSIPINRYYGSYLDYDPYTKITCYLPYIGEIEVNPDQVMQTSLMVLYYVNVITGDIVAILCANESIIYTAAGNCVRQLPLSQKDYSAIINTAVAAVSTIAVAGVGGAIAGAVGGAVAGAAKTSAGAMVAEARTNGEITNQIMGAGNSLIGNVMSSKMRYKHAGSIGTGSGQLTYQTPYLTIERPNLDLAENYKSHVGYPCNRTMQLSRCAGFTQIEATRLSISGATDEEATEILQHLVEGVII